jgi:YVTN family beta-propeller protein
VVNFGIPVGSFPFGIAVTPDGSKVYVANSGDNTISIIDTATNTVVGSPIQVGTRPTGVAVTPDGKKVYVTNNGGTVSVIGTATNTVVATISVAGLNQFSPYGVAVTPDGKKVYVANGHVVSVIRTATDTVVATIPVDNSILGLFGVAVTPDGSKVYVTAGKNCTGTSGCAVFVIDTATNTILATIQNDAAESIGVAVTADGSKSYVANTLVTEDVDGCTVSVIDTATNTVIKTIFVTPSGICGDGGGAPTAFGKFIQPVPGFAGTPGSPNCTGSSIAAIIKKYGSLNAAANALGVSTPVLQASISEFCS